MFVTGGRGTDDTDGKTLRVFTNQPAEGSLDLGQLPAGIYTLQAFDGKKSFTTKKFIKLNE